MKNRIIIIFLLLSTVSFNLFAATKKVDPWKYEPKRREGTDILDIIAERTVEKSVLDQVIDNTTLHDVIAETEKRSAAVNASSPAAKKAMGSSMRSRIFKSINKGGVWGIAGSLAVESLLEGVGWIIDEGSQVIYRYEDQQTGGGISCSANIMINGKYYKTKWQATVDGGDPVPCPLDAAKEALKNMTDKYHFNYEFLRWGVEVNVGKEGWTKEFFYSAPYGEGHGAVQAQKDESAYLPQDKVTLSDEQLADYMLGQAKDSPQKGVHTGVNEIFKPENDYEYEYSPAVQIAKHAIDNGTVIRDETDTNTNVNPKPDGTSGFQLPSFCSWAKYVCDFVDWVKKDDLPDKDDSDLNVTQDFEEKAVNISWSAQCPQPVYESVTLHGVTGQVKVADYSYICSLDWLIKPFVLGFASISALFILFGFNKGSED
ncbi:virulence factor TspB C-terminal domain-related protein [Acinetobacter nosocomialis]|uniref:virulence factor TspB C-terminal domain-related protein n=1 Tax=Acinetobacter nosocomialis TaxID=106654 RepID=UPI00124FAE05|nr:virulence factor TspB C-terminal domain-related protein [Acinetobacter nosocomialis]